jgi:transcriptional regulator with XRE-family HTH domain
MRPYGKHMGSLLRWSRIRANRSQGELAFLLGYNCKGQIISNVERGRCNLPLWLLPRISRALSVPFETLLDAHLKDVLACEKYEAMRLNNEFLDSPDQSDLKIVPKRRKARDADKVNTGLLQ